MTRRRLILTADDFGLAVPVNEAIERGHREGVLRCASLMVGAPAAEDAIERTRRLPGLCVGLHVVLVEGRPLLPPESVPDLVDANGEFGTRLVRAGFRFFFGRGVRAQLEAEIRAQFQAFRDTGLQLDHVNAHNHLQLHPTVQGLILRIGREFGLRAMRLPYEPPGASARAAGQGRWTRAVHALALAPVTGLLRSRLRRGRIHYNDFVFGLHDSGRMEEELLLRQLKALPAGVSEIYFHVATARCPELDRHTPEYRYEAEFAALLSPRVRATLRERSIETIAFGDLGPDS